MNNPSHICPLCHATDCTPYHRDKTRAYFRCTQCHLVFVPVHQHVSLKDEKEHYDLHENDPLDQGYRTFLNRLVTPLSTHLAPQASGLDFGCGPGPTLSVILEERGHNMTLYDKFYAADDAAFDATYDFITATEVIEHLPEPKVELARLWSCLKPGGWLGIMTKMVNDHDAFTTWHYTLDPTHICFYSRDTFTWLSLTLDADLYFEGTDVILLYKR